MHAVQLLFQYRFPGECLEGLVVDEEDRGLSPGKTPAIRQALPA
jgi:hypothetical protein